jgi:putative pyruvate formate lyase activating enzyme
VPDPCYLATFESGALEQKMGQALELLRACTVCARNCGANRLEHETGVCETGRHPFVSSAFAHRGEEDCLRGSRGSGTIFFSHCNLKCLFCQNFDISWEGGGQVVSPPELADLMMHLQRTGCHNINFVTPSHVVPQILEALPIAVERGLRLPLVYNTGGYDALETIRLLDGVMDIYMPDFKFWDPRVAERLADAEDYPERARDAVKEMHRQVGDLVTDDAGIAVRGLLIRHLVLPNDLAGTAGVMQFLAKEVSADTFVNLMPQYRPCGHVRGKKEFQDLDRHPSDKEMKEAFRVAREAGIRRFDERRRFLGFDV